MLVKIFSGSKSVLPHLNMGAIINAIAQLCQCHVKFIHPGMFLNYLMEKYQYDLQNFTAIIYARTVSKNAIIWQQAAKYKQ